MDKIEDKETRYYIDLDLASRKIISWNYGPRLELKQTLDSPFMSRVFVSKGQYNKLIKTQNAVEKNTAG